MIYFGLQMSEILMISRQPKLNKIYNAIFIQFNVKKKNIFIIILDSIRADKFFGSNKTSQTPNIDKLIKNGVYFKNTVSPSDGTLLGWAGIFSGQYPFRTGIFLGGFSKMNKNNLTLFDILKKNDYNFYGHLPELASKIGLFPKFENKNVFFKKNRNFEDGLGQEIISELTSNLKSPWCYILHSYDMHFPITLPKEFDKNEFGKIKYDRVMSSIDYWIGKFINCINLENTLLIITADHGELLGENNQYSHPPNSKHEILRDVPWFHLKKLK